MERSIELKIQQDLLRGQSPAFICQSFFKQVESGFLSPSHFVSILNFCLSSGNKKKLFELTVMLMEMDQAVPWAQVLKALQVVSPVPQDVLEEIVENSHHQAALFRIVWPKEATELHPKIARARSTLIEELKALREQRQKELKENIEFFVTNRANDEAVKVLDKIAEQFPEAIDVAKTKEELAERRAREVIARGVDASSHVLDRAENLRPERSLEEEKLSQILFKECKKLSSQDPGRIYDFAIMFYFLELFEEALEILNLDKGKLRSLVWVRFDLLLQTRRFVELLSLSQNVERNESRDPEAVLACCYYRAQAFWGLGRKTKAIEMMEQIKALRPAYRSTSSLLTSWRSKTQ